MPGTSSPPGWPRPTPRFRTRRSSTRGAPATPAPGLCTPMLTASFSPSPGRCMAAGTRGPVGARLGPMPIHWAPTRPPRWCVSSSRRAARKHENSAARTVGSAALPGHRQLAFGSESLQVAGQHLFDVGERVGVLGGGLEHQLVVLGPDGSGAVGKDQPCALPLAGNRLDGVLASEMGEELLRVAFGGVSGYHRG